MADQSNEMGMVEKVARAIYAVDGGKGWHLHEKFYMDSARAAIEAMREPTEIMLVAGCNHDDPLGGLVDWRGENVTTRETIGGVFTAMIDAVLSHDEVKG